MLCIPPNLIYPIHPQRDDVLWKRRFPQNHHPGTGVYLPVYSLVLGKIDVKPPIQPILCLNQLLHDLAASCERFPQLRVFPLWPIREEVPSVNHQLRYDPWVFPVILPLGIVIQFFRMLHMLWGNQHVLDVMFIQVIRQVEPVMPRRFKSDDCLGKTATVHLIFQPLPKFLESFSSIGEGERFSRKLYAS